MTQQRAISAFPRWRLIIGGAVIVVIAITLFLLFGSSQLEQRISAMRSQGLPTNAAELNSWYKVPAGETDNTALWTAATSAVEEAGIAGRAASIPIVGLGPTPIPNPGIEWAELDISRTFLDELDNEFQLIMRAANAGGVARYPGDFSKDWNAALVHRQELRVIARLLSLRGHVHAHDDQHPEVLKDVVGIFAVSDSLSAEPVVISEMLRIATHAIGCQLASALIPHCRWIDEELAELQIAIGRARFREELLTAIHGELALCLTTLENSSGILFRNSSKLKAIELFTESISGLETSWLEAIKRNQEIDAALKTLSGSTISRMKYMMLLMMMPALQHAITAGQRAEARQSCAIAIIAARRYRLQHGSLPKSLADLQDLIPGDAVEKSLRLMDPFDGQPLRFTIDHRGLVIYSVGDNRVDDGGNITAERPREGDLGYSIDK